MHTYEYKPATLVNENCTRVKIDKIKEIPKIALMNDGKSVWKKKRAKYGIFFYGSISNILRRGGDPFNLFNLTGQRATCILN